MRGSGGCRTEQRASAMTPADLPSLDWTCAGCGARAWHEEAHGWLVVFESLKGGERKRYCATCAKTQGREPGKETHDRAN